MSNKKWELIEDQALFVCVKNRFGTYKSWGGSGYPKGKQEEFLDFCQSMSDVFGVTPLAINARIQAGKGARAFKAEQAKIAARSVGFIK